MSKYHCVVTVSVELCVEADDQDEAYSIAWFEGYSMMGSEGNTAYVTNVDVDPIVWQ